MKYETNLTVTLRACFYRRIYETKQHAREKEFGLEIQGQGQHCTYFLFSNVPPIQTYRIPLGWSLHITLTYTLYIYSSMCAILCIKDL